MERISIFTLQSSNPFLHSSSSSCLAWNQCQTHLALSSPLNPIGGGRVCVKPRTSSCRFVVLSTHSNPKIVKSNRRSRYGQALSPYDTDEEGEEDDEDEDEDDVGGASDDDWLLNDDFAEIADFNVKNKSSKSKKGYKRSSTREGNQKQAEKHWGRPSLGLSADRGHLNDRNGKYSLEKSNGSYGYASNRMEVKSSDVRKAKITRRQAMEKKYPRLTEEIDLDEKWMPLLDYLSTFGLKESHFIQMYERHMPSLQINICSAEERLEYLLSVGVKHRDIRKILLRQPQILEYTVEKNLKSHVAFLMNLGIPSSRVGQIIAAAPSIFSYSVENSLKPTVRYLVEVGIKEKDLGKVVQLSPQILVQRIDISWNTRYIFLSKELGAPRDSVVKMVTKHPQLLHYSIDDGLLPRINFLRSIGMRNADILKVLTSLTQVLSLSLEDNLKPKYMYLINELHNEVHSLTKYPMYLSLSLDQRIRPRHRFLVSLKKAPKGPFPLSSLVPTDECFCQQWAGTSLDTYLAFRQRLLLKEFAKKFERKG
ncbi:transcription termination factor MTERF9, chloroplastic [Ziziphus jujuba]|uniref:Transcription termination factor MTERF9, chloroplastic n=1 Tax=Ziziphus jujuba TaxID=326968 RepID=A0A6P4AY39_ZIZJJ|nr:transcription termination factor MTERF9, chloroplastic [Ziziphus jujuba]